jgi:hypothetical protein
MPGLEGLFAGSMSFVLLLYTAIPLFPLLYVIIRWRARGAGEPGLGYRSGLLYLRTVALLVLVTGTGLLLHGVLSQSSESRSMDEMRRVAHGVIVGSAAFFLVTFTLVRSLGDAVGAVDAARVFHGFVLLISGLVTFTALTVLCVLMFQKSAEMDDLREPLAWLIVWASTWLAHVVILRSPSAGT